MAKRIFIIAAPGRDNEAAEAEQILREYDYDVVNPRIIEEYEKNKVKLGLLDDDFGWLKRDIRKLLDCDGYCLLSDPEVGTEEWDFEDAVLSVAENLPWMMEQTHRIVDSWIEASDG